MFAPRLCLILLVLSSSAAAQRVVYLDADSPATGKHLDVAPLVTDFGTITFSGEVRPTADPDFIAAGSFGDVFNILSGSCALTFDFDVSTVSFIYGGNAGHIGVEARDATGAIVDSFFQADTGNGQPAGPVSLTGTGIRSLHWEDTGGSFAPLSPRSTTSRSASPRSTSTPTRRRRAATSTSFR